MAVFNKHVFRFDQLIRDIFAELGDFESFLGFGDDDAQSDMTIVSKSTKQTYRFGVKIRERITPQIADDLFERFQAEPLSDGTVRIVYAPVISPRVAEIARKHGISFVDYAGNCCIVDEPTGLLISRSGIPNEASSQKKKQADPF